MNYLKFALGQQSAGSIIEVTLSGVESDVFLVDPSNLRSFETGGSFRYTGGHYKQSPVRIAVPSSDAWTVVVVPGPGGRVQASVRALTTV
jgi:hypothetical protein